MQVDSLSACQSARYENDCKRPARWRYVSATVGMPPIELCDDDAYDLMRTSGIDKARFISLVSRRTTLRCRKCAAVVRVENVGLNVSNTFRYCVSCGKPNIEVINDGEIDYWSLLSESIGLPVPVTKSLYAMWDSRSGQRFVDFVTEIREEARKDNLNATA